MKLSEIAEDSELLEIGRKAIEDVLIEYRDHRISVLGCGNGFVVREKDGGDSSIIRLATWEGLRIGVKAIAEKLES